MARVPFVIVHCGASWYLNYSLRQAVHCNGRDGVVLLGDTASGRIADTVRVPWVHIESLEADLVDEFRSSYVHMCTNPYDYEVLCWVRWIYMHQFMVRHGVDRLFYIDSDVLAYQSTGAILDHYGDGLAEFGLLAPKQEVDSLRWAYNGAISFWNEEALGRFSRFAVRTFGEAAWRSEYERKWGWHQSTGTPGGINDMTGLYLFARDRQFTNFAKPHRGRVFDAGMHSATNHIEGEFEFDAVRGHKTVRMRQRDPWLVGSTGPVAASALHFAGPTRSAMRTFYTGPNFAAHLRWKVGRLWRRVG